MTRVHEIRLKYENMQFQWCGYFHKAEAWNHESRKNPDFELIIVTKGTLKLKINHRRFEFKKGEMVLIEPDTHFIGYGDEKEVCFYWLHFIAQYADELTTQTCQLPMMSRTILLDHELVLIQQMQTIKQLDLTNTTLINSYLQTLLISVSEKYKHPFYLKQNKHYVINYMKKFLQRNYQRTITIEEIAQYFGYNKAYISNLFSREVGETMTQYVNSLRLENARQLLLTTNETICHIANKNGFDDEKYFSRLFSKKYYQSPSAYRKYYQVDDQVHQN